jgi:site-specific DNA recombinase
MIAAIYARKSTDDSDHTAEARSTARQIDHATEYARAKGWNVDPRYIFTDENTSGAEWKHRPGFNALLTALGYDQKTNGATRDHGAPPFGVLIVSELSRIGRDTVRVPYAVQQIEEAGVEIHGYLSGQRISVDDELGEMQTMLHSLAASYERRRARQRTHDALRRRAEVGAVTGGKLYGYTNQRNADGFVHRVIDEAQASVVRHIWALHADGNGLTKISKRLNAEGVRSPRGDTSACSSGTSLRRSYAEAPRRNGGDQKPSGSRSRCPSFASSIQSLRPTCTRGSKRRVRPSRVAPAVSSSRVSGAWTAQAPTC